MNEIYCEVVRSPNTEVEVSLKWTLHNARINTPWPEGLQVIPVLSAPSVRMFFESDICQLEPNADSDLNVKLKIPQNSESHYYVLLLKIKTGQRYFTGPNMVAFIKLIDPQKALLVEQSDSENQEN